MAPNCPEEVDVFTVPHSRMKELVQKYLDMMTSANFSDVFHLTTLLKNLLNTFHEFKAHEQIENKYIMKKLKSKLKALSIQNTAVCNCHKDNKLTDILSLLEDGYQCTKKSLAERINYGIKLRKALEDFTQDFIPHMEEEEEVFQPLLMQYFTFDELRELKAQVLEQHFEKTECSKTSPDSEKYVQDSLSTETKEEEKSDNPEEDLEIEQLPDEVLLNIFSYLNPQDLCRSAQVCRNWNKLAFYGSFWKNLYPVQWAKGHWDYHLGDYVEEEEEEENGMDFLMAKRLDEDADIDESEGIEERQEDSWACQVRHESQILTDMIKYLIPKVGSFVRTCSFAYSKGLSNGILYRIFSHCPNMEYLDLTQTRITDLAFKGLEQRKGGCKLHHLDLSGCLYITDKTLKRLAHSYGVTNHNAGDFEVSDNEGQYKTQQHQLAVEIVEESTNDGHDKIKYWNNEKTQEDKDEVDSLDTKHPKAPGKQLLDNDVTALNRGVSSDEVDSLNTKHPKAPEKQLLDNDVTALDLGVSSDEVDSLNTKHPKAPGKQLLDNDVTALNRGVSSDEVDSLNTKHPKAPGKQLLDNDVTALDLGVSSDEVDSLNTKHPKAPGKQLLDNDVTALDLGVSSDEVDSLNTKHPKAPEKQLLDNDVTALDFGVSSDEVDSLNTKHPKAPGKQLLDNDVTALDLGVSSDEVDSLNTKHPKAPGKQLLDNDVTALDLGVSSDEVDSLNTKHPKAPEKQLRYNDVTALDLGVSSDEVDSLNTKHPKAPGKQLLDNDVTALDRGVSSDEDRTLNHCSNAVNGSESSDKNNAKQKEIDIENCAPNAIFSEKMLTNAKDEGDTCFHLDNRAAVPAKTPKSPSSDAGFNLSWTFLPDGDGLDTARYIHYQGLSNKMVEDILKNLPSCCKVDDSTSGRNIGRKCCCDIERTTCRHTKPMCDALKRTNSEREPRTECGSQTVPQRLDPGQPYACSLEFLSLSGCFQITDEGLRSLTGSGGLPYLVHLDLSGCLKITGGGLDEFVSHCTRLNPEHLFYCDNILDGPYLDSASGCQNLQCTSRICCRSGE